MSLRDAIRMMGTTVRVPTRSDNELVCKVVEQQTSSLAASSLAPSSMVVAQKQVSVAQGLSSALTVRPIDAMLELAKGTVLNADPNITAFTQRWPILRYLGVFAQANVAEPLCLDDEALKFIGANQRRVMSEDLGIGFGILAGQHWCQSRNPGVQVITAVDVDQTLNAGTVAGLRRSGDRQPDYLLRYVDPARPEDVTYDLLETKGTVNVSNAAKQLGRAATQLMGLQVDDQFLTGLATSTVSNESAVQIFAVDPEHERFRWQVNSGVLEKRRDVPSEWRRTESGIKISADELVVTSTRVGHAALAEFAGQSVTAQEWEPRLVPRRGREDRSSVRTIDGETFIGDALSFEMRSGERVRLFRGVERNVAEGLRGKRVEEVTRAQLDFARDRAARRSSGSNDENAVAFGDDGSVLEITVG